MKIKIAIASNIDFYKSTLPIIIPSLIESGINKDDIHVFIGGYNSYNYEIIDEIHYHYVDHNSYENTPLIEIVDKEIESDYWFLTHDTCRFGLKFKELLYNVPEEIEKVALRTWPSMDIGTYKYSYLISLKEKIMATKNSDYSKESMKYWKDWTVMNEDWLLWNTAPAPQVYNNIHDVYTINNYNWYGTEIERITQYYPSLDMYKNKANWGQNWNHDKDLYVRDL